MSTGPHLHVDVSKNAVDWQGIKTLDGIISNMVDYEKWSEQIDFNYKVAVPTPIPTVEPEIAPTVRVFTKDELMSHVNTFIALFITVALPQIQTFDWQNASQASVIALLGVIVRAVVKALSEKYITAKI